MSKHRFSEKWRAGCLLVAGAVGVAMVPASADAAASQDYPTFTLNATNSLSGGLRGDIDGSAFVDKNGGFHWISSYATYATTDTGSDTNTFSNTDMGALNAQAASGTTEITADTWYGHAGSLCYQVDKAAADAAPSPYEDDHCDVVGMWVDPKTGAWHGVVNDEYDFNPWSTAGPTVVQRVSTGIHANRILTATSTDNGVTWKYGGEIITSPYTDNDAFDATALPGKTWNYGVAGCRLFVDYATGYFYVTYNTQFKVKPNYTTFVSWPAVARAPISGGMAPGTWNKFGNGNWQQPGIAGLDGVMDEPLGLNATYVPATDAIDFTGTGANGVAVDYRSVYPGTAKTFTFKDAAGTVYTANSGTGVITNSAGTTVTSVSYQDPALNSSVTVSTVGATVSIAVTDANGVVNSSVVGAAVFEDTSTQRLYLAPRVQEPSLTYNTYTNSYFSVDYDTNVYQTFDLGKPNSFSVVGAEPSGATSSYLSSLDMGSLTNQNISTRSYRILSGLNGGAWDVTLKPHSASQTHWAAAYLPVDSAGTKVVATSTYGLTLGGTALTDSGSTASTKNQWKLIGVTNTYDASYTDGIYKLQNVATGQYLEVPGTTPAASRAVGAAVTTGAAQANYSPAGNGNNGAPGGSDQWYLQAVGKDTPTTLSASSTSAQIAAATNTSLTGATTYKLVNRNSGLALEYVNGSWQLAGQDFNDAGQPVTLTKLS